MSKQKTRIPVIVCAGDPAGRAVIFGWVAEEPQIGQPCRLERARMILRFGGDGRGLFGIAARGPHSSTRVTSAVPSVSCTSRQILFCSEEAGAALDRYDE